jgi:hypothetical protein
MEIMLFSEVLFNLLLLEYHAVHFLYYIVPVLKHYSEVNRNLHTFLTWPLDDDEWSALPAVQYVFIMSEVCIAMPIFSWNAEFLSSTYIRNAAVLYCV